MEKREGEKNAVEKPLDVGLCSGVWAQRCETGHTRRRYSVRLELEVEERLFCLARSSRSDPIQILHQQGEHGQGVWNVKIERARARGSDGRIM
jgi:hypothetical protein